LQKTSQHIFLMMHSMHPLLLISRNSLLKLFYLLPLKLTPMLLPISITNSRLILIYTMQSFLIIHKLIVVLLINRILLSLQLISQ
jgi:hypothetical protein